MKTSDLIGLKVANDGLSLRKALETEYDIVGVKHIGNFVFKAKCKDQTSLLVITKPVELAGFHLRIVDIRKLG